MTVLPLLGGSISRVAAYWRFVILSNLVFNSKPRLRIILPIWLVVIGRPSVYAERVRSRLINSVNVIAGLPPVIAVRGIAMIAENLLNGVE